MKIVNLVVIILTIMWVSSCASPTPTTPLTPTLTPISISSSTPTPTATRTSAPSTTQTPTQTTTSTPSPTTVITPPTTTPSTTPPPTPGVNGILEDIKGVPILRVWGSSYEMGYAYGYIYAHRLEEYVKASLNALIMDPTGVTCEGMVDRLQRYTLWSNTSLEEARGILGGIEAALGELPVITHPLIEAGSRQLDLDMLLFCNCLSNIMSVEQICSGFAVWGEATEDGKTKAGGNVDLPDRSIASFWLLIVREPDNCLSTVSLHVYGAPMGCLFKGMNETGLVLSNQGAYGIYPTWAKVTKAGYTDILIRDILEQVAAGPDMIDNVTEMFEKTESIFSGTFLFAQKRYTTENSQPNRMAVVIEKDPFGFDVRLPSHNNICDTPLQEAIFATNHFLLRQVPEECVTPEDSMTRYEGMVASLIDHPVSGLPGMQKVLQGASVPDSIHSIYFEPDSLIIHVAYGTVEGPPSPSLTPVTLTWEELFAPIPN